MTHFRKSSSCLVALVLLVTSATNVLSYPPTFAHGKAYQFERVQATLRNNLDGDVTLVSYVYKPVAFDNEEVVVFSHGSTGHGSVAPGEPVRPHRALIEFFVSRGYTLVMPMRRGRGESSGTYGEECGTWSGLCSLADETSLFASGLDDANVDLMTVIDQVVLGSLVARDAKVLLAGVSRGGFLSLEVAARQPDVVKGVINFVGGWLSVRDEYPPDEYKTRVALQNAQFRSVGKRSRAPTIWIYGARDPFYDRVISRGFFDSFSAAGGNGEYLYIGNHEQASGHGIHRNSRLWADQVETFLERLDLSCSP